MNVSQVVTLMLIEAELQTVKAIAYETRNTELQEVCQSALVKCNQLLAPYAIPVPLLLTGRVYQDGTLKTHE